MSLKLMKALYVRATKDAQQMGNTENFVVSIVANYKDKQGNDLPPEYSEVLLFGDAANKYGKPESQYYIKKGQSLSVEGKFQLKKWTDKQGNVQFTEQILVSDPERITLHDKKSDSNNADNNISTDTSSFTPSSDVQDDEDCPFN